MPTKIEWAEESWNPIRFRRMGKLGHGCVKVSPGCANCYAEGLNRWRGAGQPYTARGLADGESFLDEKALLKPLSWRKPRRVFV